MAWFSPQASERTESDARIQRQLVSLLSEAEGAAAELQADAKLRESSAQAASALLGAAGDAAATLRQALASLGRRMDGLRLTAGGDSAAALEPEQPWIAAQPRPEDAAAEDGQGPDEGFGEIEERLRGFLVDSAASEEQVTRFTCSMTA